MAFGEFTSLYVYLHTLRIASRISFRGEMFEFRGQGNVSRRRKPIAVFENPQKDKQLHRNPQSEGTKKFLLSYFDERKGRILKIFFPTTDSLSLLAFEISRNKSSYKRYF